MYPLLTPTARASSAGVIPLATSASFNLSCMELAIGILSIYLKRNHTHTKRTKNNFTWVFLVVKLHKRNLKELLVVLEFSIGSFFVEL
jgi:hypothetical protein